MDGKLSGRLSNEGGLSGSLSHEQGLSVRLTYEHLTVYENDYNLLKEETLPQINSVTLKGNKISSELHVQHEMDVISYQDIDNILFG